MIKKERRRGTMNREEVSIGGEDGRKEKNKE